MLGLSTRGRAAERAWFLNEGRDSARVSRRLLESPGLVGSVFFAGIFTAAKRLRAGDEPSRTIYASDGGRRRLAIRRIRCGQDSARDQRRTLGVDARPLQPSRK